MYFLILNETFVTILTLVAAPALVDALTKTFTLVLKERKTIFHLSLGKIEDSLQTTQYFEAEYGH